MVSLQILLIVLQKNFAKVLHGLYNILSDYILQKMLWKRDQRRFNEECWEYIQILLILQKGFYPYKDMDSWQRFNETSLSDNKEFSSNLNMEDINDAEYGKSYIIKLWLKLKLWIKINSLLESIDQPRTCRIFMLHWIKSVFIN